MSPTDTPLQQIPLVFTAPGSPVHDLVASTGDEAADEMSRSIWSEFRHDLMHRLTALAKTNGNPDALAQELHALRGTSAQFGLFLLEIMLFAWEKKEPEPVSATSRYLPGALAIAPLSLEAIEREFPHLKSQRE